LTIDALGAWAHLCAALGASRPAAMLLGANWAWFAQRGRTVDPVSDEAWIRVTGLDVVRDDLGPDEWDRAIAEGGELTLEDAVSLVFRAIDASAVEEGASEPNGTMTQ
jgi:hypothetical protein